MTIRPYSTANELAEKMGKPQHIGSLEAALEESAFIPFTPGVIKDVSTNQHELKVILDYSPLKDYVENNIAIIGTSDYSPSHKDAVPSTVNSIMWTSLENALYGIGGGTAGEIEEGNPTSGRDQCLGFDYRFTFRFLQDQSSDGEVKLRITQNRDYNEEVLREDLIQAYSQHLRRAI